MDWGTRVGELKQHGRFRAAVELLAEVLPTLGETERAEALSERAAILERIFAEPRAAAEAWLAAYEVDPTRIEDLARARDALIALADWAGAAALVTRELGVVQEPKHAADLLVLHGDLLQEANDDVGARASYLRALELVPEQRFARANIDDLESDDLDARLLAAQDDAAEGKGAAVITGFLRAARIARRSDGNYRGFVMRAAVLDPSDPVAGGMLDDACAEDKPGKRLELARTLLEETTGRERAACARAIAGRWSDRFEDADGALALLSIASEADRADPAAELAAARLMSFSR